MSQFFEKNLGQLISLRRNELGLSQDQLANIVDMSRAHIARIEQGRSAPPLKTLVNLNEALKINLLDNQLITSDKEGISAEDYEKLSTRLKVDSVKSISNLQMTVIVHSADVSLREIIVNNNNTGQNHLHSLTSNIPNANIISVTNVPLL